MIKLWSMFPSTPSVDGEIVPREFRALKILGPPGAPMEAPLDVVDGRVYLAENYVFIEDEGRGQTHVFGLQSVQLGFQPMAD